MYEDDITNTALPNPPDPEFVPCARCGVDTKVVPGATIHYCSVGCFLD